MTFDLRAILVLAVTALLLQVVLGIAMQPGWKKFFRNVFWPEINDSSVIVFHYTCWMGVIVATLVLLHMDVGRGRELPAAELTGKSLLQYLDAQVEALKNGWGKILILWISGLILTNFLTVLLLDVYRHFFTSQREFQTGTMTELTNANSGITNLQIHAGSVSDELHRTRSRIDSIHQELRFLNKPPEIAAETLACCVRELDELKETESPQAGDHNEIHLILSVDSVLPNSFTPSIPTILFSQLQVNWAERYSHPQAIRAGRVQTGSPPKYFQSGYSDSAGAALDKMLGEALVTCVNRLLKNHAPDAFDASAGSVNDPEYPRAVRVLLGTEGALVNTAEDFAGLECAFPQFAHARVLNLWIPKATGEKLFEVAENVDNGIHRPEFPGFTVKWKQQVKDFLTSRGIHTTDEHIFSYVSQLSKGDWPNLDCLQIGLRLLQVGYDEGPTVTRMVKDPTQAKKELLVFCEGIFPVILAALHYQNVLSFPDIMHYIRSNCDNLDGAQKEAKKRALLKQLDEFQRTGKFNPL